MGVASRSRQVHKHGTTRRLLTEGEHVAAQDTPLSGGRSARRHPHRKTRLLVAWMAALVCLVVSCTTPRPPTQPTTASPTTPPSATATPPRSPAPSEPAARTLATEQIPLPAPGQRGASVLVDAELRWNVPRPGCVQMRTGRGVGQLFDAVGQLVTDDNRAGTFPARHLRVVGHVTTQRASACSEYPVFVITAIVGANGSAGAGPLWPE